MYQWIESTWPAHWFTTSLKQPDDSRPPIPRWAHQIRTRRGMLSHPYKNKMDSRDLMNPRSDQGPSTCDGGLRLKLMNRYAPSNREHQSRDGWSSGVLLRLTAPARTGRGGAMAGPRESLNLRYRIPIAMWFLPMRSRTREEPNIHTYGGVNRRWSHSANPW
jgi:hypothetical protein